MSDVVISAVGGLFTWFNLFYIIFIGVCSWISFERGSQHGIDTTLDLLIKKGIIEDDKE